MKTLNLNVILNQGTDFSLIIQVPGTPPPDITAYSFEGQMKASSDPDAEVVAQFEFDILNQTTNPGQVRWFLDPADSEDIITTVITSYPLCRTPTPFVFDIKMTDSLGTITRIIQGVIEVSPEVTRAVVP